jgi:hypothetical protein
MAVSDTNVAMLEVSGANEELGWLRKCYHHLGANVAEIGADRTCAVDEGFRELI